jgi:hypothetical protein
MDFKVGDRVMVDLPGCFSNERTGTMTSLHPCLPNCLRVLVDGTSSVFTVPKDCCRKVEVIGGLS